MASKRSSEQIKRDLQVISKGMDRHTRQVQDTVHRAINADLDELERRTDLDNHDEE